MANRTNQRGALDQLVARCGKNSRFRNRTTPVASAPRALQSDRNRARRANLANQINRPDINSQFQRSRRHQRANFPGLEFSLDRQPPLARQTAVMRRDRVLSENRREMMADALGQSPRVHKNQSRAMLLNEVRNSACKSRPTFRLKRRGPTRSMELPPRGPIGAAAQFPRWRVPAGRFRQETARSPQSVSASRKVRCASSDCPVSASSRSSESARCEPRLSSAIAWISSTITVFTVRRHFAALFGGQQNVKRFRRRDQNMRRPLLHRAALVHQRVAGAHGRANFRHQISALPRKLQNFAQRRVQIFLNVVAECFQRRNVQALQSCLPVLRKLLCAPGGRCTPEMPREFCPNPSARRSAWSFRPECAANPAPAARSACRICRRTTPKRAGAPIRGVPETGNVTRADS